MLRYFRINDPYRLVGLLVIMLLITLPLFIDPPPLTIPELKNIVVGEKLNEDYSLYTELADNTAPFAAWFQELTETLFGRSVLARHIAAFILIFLQSAYLGIMFISRKVFNENTYIPSLLFFLLFLFSFDTLSLSNELIGSTFLLLALNNLFKEIEFRVQRDETIFNLGLFISLASLFSFAFSVYLICAMVILIFFTRTSLRKFLLLAFGFLLPHLMLISITYLSGALSKYWEYYYLANLNFSRNSFINSKGLLVLGSVPIVYFVISVIMLNRESRFSKYQSQLLQIMFLWMGFSFAYLLVCKDLRPQNLITLVPALAFLFTHFFLFIRRKKFIEMNTWILFLGIITTSYLARYNKLDSVNYSRLFVKNERTDLRNKRILIFADDISPYQQSKLATPYLNWELSQHIFRNPDYYETVTEVYHYFEKDAPDVVLDKENVLLPFLDRIPELKRQYIRKGTDYWRISPSK